MVVEEVWVWFDVEAQDDETKMNFARSCVTAKSVNGGRINQQ